MTRNVQLLVGGLTGLVFVVNVAHAQDLQGLRASTTAQDTSLICGRTVVNPSALPPVGSGPVVYLIATCFEGQGGVARTQAVEYVRDIQLRPSRPSQGEWVPFDEAAEQTVLEDFRRLWASHRLADLSVEIRNYRFPNGVIGKLVTFNIVEQK